MITPKIYNNSIIFKIFYVCLFFITSHFSLIAARSEIIGDDGNKHVSPGIIPILASSIQSIPHFELEHCYHNIPHLRGSILSEIINSVTWYRKMV